MKKLIQLLAVSAGGGLLLGAGLRLGEGRRSNTAPVSEEAERRISQFLERLEALEKRIGSHQPAPSADFAPPDSNRPDIQQNLQVEITAQISAMEARLRRDLSRRDEDRIGSLSAQIHKRIEDRLGPLEAEIATQRVSVDELREYSLRTERTLQKVLDGVDRLVAAQPSRGAGG